MKRKTPAQRRRAPAPAAEPPRLIAVVDIGARAIRMEIAEIRPDGRARTLESLSRPVALGKETFSVGVIQRATIEECVAILRDFRAVLDEYGIQDPRRISAVATSAVREARNREAFLDRVYLATRIPVQCIAEAELNRLTYLAVRDLLTREHVRTPARLLVADVGGGSTEILLIDRQRALFSETYRLGSLRLREELDAAQAPPARVRAMLTQDIRRVVAQIKRDLPADRVPAMIAMSGDIRFAAAQLADDWNDLSLARLPAEKLAAFTERVLGMTADRIVREFRISYAEAETVGPALLAYQQLAAAFQTREFLVPKISLRTALELDMAGRAVWSDLFCDQIEHSALALADKFRADRRHALYVADIARQFYDALQDDHRLDPKYRFLLRIAALLHDVGFFISSRSHHKHSMYLILNSELFGLTREDLTLVALVARYHRRSPPRLDHPEYAALPRDERLRVLQLAALLRVADALDRHHAQRLRELAFVREGGRLIVTAPDADDLTLERVALREKGVLFQDVFGLEVALRRGPAWREPEGTL